MTEEARVEQSVEDSLERRVLRLVHKIRTMDQGYATLEDAVNKAHRFLAAEVLPILKAKEEADRQRDEARATKDMHKDRQEDEIARADAARESERVAWERAEQLAKRCTAQERFLIAYRTGGSPADRDFKAMEETRAALSSYEAAKKEREVKRG